MLAPDPRPPTPDPRPPTPDPRPPTPAPRGIPCPRMQITGVETAVCRPLSLRPGHTPTTASSGLAKPAPGASSRRRKPSCDKFANYLVGQDPLRIEHHWQYLYRSTHFRGAAIMGALSAIDIALWDIAGKHFGVPVYQLLGGKTRDKRAGLLPRLRRHRGGAGCRLRRRQRPRLHGGWASVAVWRRAARATVLQDPRCQDGRRHRRRAPVPRSSRATRSICASRSTAG